jgi:hypothetical protein
MKNAMQIIFSGFEQLGNPGLKYKPRPFQPATQQSIQVVYTGFEQVDPRQTSCRFSGSITPHCVLSSFF